MKDLLEKLRTEGGIIRSTAGLDEHDIKQARASDRIWVDEDGYGFIWFPFMDFPTDDNKLKRWKELEAKYFPLPDNRPLPEKLCPDKIWEEAKRQYAEIKRANNN